MSETDQFRRLAQAAGVLPPYTDLGKIRRAMIGRGLRAYMPNDWLHMTKKNGTITTTLSLFSLNNWSNKNGRYWWSAYLRASKNRLVLDFYYNHDIRGKIVIDRPRMRMDKQAKEALQVSAQEFTEELSRIAKFEVGHKL